MVSANFYIAISGRVLSTPRRYYERLNKGLTMEEVTVKHYQELAMRTCLPSAKNWEYCDCLIAFEIGEAFGKWGKKFRDGSFDKDKLADELGDVFWGVALACELGGYSLEELWRIEGDKPYLYIRSNHTTNDPICFFPG